MEPRDSLLDDLERRACLYFREAADPKTGLVLDRARVQGKETRTVASISATGFGLSAMCIGAERGYIDTQSAQAQVRRTLEQLANETDHERGFFYHFIDAHTGERWKNAEISTSDSIWLLAGALTCRQYFHEDREIGDLATLLYSRYDFPWMTNGDGKLLSHGWTPDGFIKFRYDKYCQLAAMYLLGIGSPTHALPPDAWYAWGREPNSYANYNYIGTSLLWTYQYPFAWFDFRGRRESRGTKVDWLENCRVATRAHREWCYTEVAKEFPGYTQAIWGITSSSSPTGYAAWGGPPRHGKIDGSVVPCAAGGSLMLAPDICIPAMHGMKDKFGDKIWGRYGLADAFNPGTGWVSPDTLGLDVGVTLLSIENLRHGGVWNWFMANAEPQKAMRLAGIDTF